MTVRRDMTSGTSATRRTRGTHIALSLTLSFFAVLFANAAFGQGTVAYQSWVEGKISGVRTTANNASDKVNALERVVIGDDFVIVVTNYDSKTKMSSASFKFKRDDGTWHEVWNDLNRWMWFFDEWVPTNLYTKAQANARFAQKAWGQYTSGLGEESPDGRLWLTQPVVVSSGLEWVPFNLESSGSIWVLTANGLMPGASTGDAGSFLRITDDSGKEIFKIVKGDKEVKGAFCDDIVVRSNPDGSVRVELSYKVESAKAPTVETTASLTAGQVEWTDVPDSWYDNTDIGSSGAWRRCINVPAVSTARYFRGKYERGNESYIVNAAPVQSSGGFLATDKTTGKAVKIRPVVNGTTVTWEVFE